MSVRKLPTINRTAKAFWKSTVLSGNIIFSKEELELINGRYGVFMGMLDDKLAQFRFAAQQIFAEKYKIK